MFIVIVMSSSNRAVPTTPCAVSHGWRRLRSRSRQPLLGRVCCMSPNLCLCVCLVYRTPPASRAAAQPRGRCRCRGVCRFMRPRQPLRVTTAVSIGDPSPSPALSPHAPKPAKGAEPLADTKLHQRPASQSDTNAPNPATTYPRGSTFRAQGAGSFVADPLCKSARRVPAAALLHLLSSKLPSTKHHHQQRRRRAAHPSASPPPLFFFPCDCPAFLLNAPIFTCVPP